MNQLLPSSFQPKLENWRLRQHFKRVETILRKRDVSHLPSNLQQAREQYLGRLHDYGVRGIFPRNYERLPYSPCFIDRDGRECAVAHLVIAAGHNELANEIAAAANYAYVPQMIFPELDDWAAQSGFTKEELALIQPGYWMEFDSSVLLTAVTVWSVGIVTALVNIIQILRKRIGVVWSVNGIVMATFLLLFSLFFLWEALGAYSLGTHPDGYPYDLPLKDVAPLRSIGMISLALTLLTGSVSFYRIRTYIQSRPKKKGRYKPANG